MKKVLIVEDEILARLGLRQLVDWRKLELELLPDATDGEEALEMIRNSCPDIILLDEPTNHLDMSSIAWLETYLLNYRGAVLIVAHDRYFLDKIVTKVIELDNGHAVVYSGN